MSVLWETQGYTTKIQIIYLVQPYEIYVYFKNHHFFRHSAAFSPRKTDSMPEGFFFYVHFCFSFKLVWKPAVWKLEDMSSPSFVIPFLGSQISLSPACSGSPHCPIFKRL